MFSHWCVVLFVACISTDMIATCQGEIPARRKISDLQGYIVNSIEQTTGSGDSTKNVDIVAEGLEDSYTLSISNSKEGEGSGDEDEEDSSFQPSLLPTHPPTVVSNPPTVLPTVSPAGATSSPTSGAPSSGPTRAPTRNPTTAPSSFPTRSPTRAPTTHPTRFPTHSPIRISSRTGEPSALPTENALLAELRSPEEFSTAITSALISFVGIIAVCWAVATVLYVGRKNGYIKLPSDKDSALAGAKNKPKQQKIKKFEDYWENESDLSEDSVSKFPNRAAAIGGVSAFDDYWDDNIEFSAHSTDDFNIPRNL